MRNKSNIQNYRDYAKSKGGKCLSAKAINTYTKMLWQCNEGHKWKALANNVLRGSWCPKCSGKSKRSIADMKALAEVKGGLCLSSKYVNVAIKLKWRCREGHVWFTPPRNIISGKWCPKCGLANRKVGSKKLTLDLMKEIANSRGGTCISTKYINAKTNLKWKCKQGHVWYATPHSVKNAKSWCAVCSGNIHYDIEFMKKLAAERNGECLSITYTNSHKPLKWRCGKGHEWSASFVNVRKKSWCPVCGHKSGADKQRGSVIDAKALAKERGGDFLSTKYTTSNSKYYWRCSVGHKWIATYNKISQGRWCPECAQGRSEKLVKELFENMFGDTFRKSRPKWLTIDNKLHELDGYSKKLKLAFEYQGIQHYEKIDFFTQNMSHERRKKIDDLKLKICSHNNVILIQIPYTVKENNLQRYITNKVIKQGYPKEKINSEQINIYQLPPYKRVDKKYLKQLAAKHNGKCLSSYMRGVVYHVNWECKRGHGWSASPSNVRRGHWCPHCAGNIRKNIKDMQMLAQTRGGICLSKKYINTKSKLKWKCKRGHVWSAVPSSIKSGRWCPYCVGKKKSIKDMQRIAHEFGGEILSKEYIDCETKYAWKCKRGHVWEAVYSNMLKGHWCTKCNKAMRNQKVSPK
jgi:hypothetical protein